MPAGCTEQRARRRSGSAASLSRARPSEVLVDFMDVLLSEVRVDRNA